MKNRVFVGIVVSVLLVLVTSGFITSYFFSRDLTKSAEPFISYLIEGNFDAARQNLFIPSGSDQTIFSDEKLIAIQSILRNNLGDNISIRFNRSQKIASTNKAEATPDGKTRVYFDLVSSGRYLEVETLVDDKSQRIQYLNSSEGSRQVPDFLPIFFVSLLFLTVPILNIYAMVVIRSTHPKGRIWRYLTVLVFNIPTITYFATGHVNLNLLADQIFFGYSINLSGLSQLSASIGIPLGAIFWIFRRNKSATNMRKVEKRASTENENEILWECPKCKHKNPNSTFECLNCGYKLN